MLGLLVLSAGAAACASSGAVPRPFPTPGAAAPAPPSVAVRGGVAVPVSAIVSAALALRGTPYRDGGSDPSGFDCSGFTQYVFARLGIALPREVRDQYREGTPVAADRIAAGDLIFFSTVAPGASHVGIAIDGDEFVHAPSSNGVVRVEHLSAKYWTRRFVGARRVD